MASSILDTLENTQFDVVICGGGLAGLTLARQLRRTHPQLSVAVVEKTTRPLPDSAHKVGESSVELGSQYLEQLGLRDYLHQHHLLKHGLRFFPGGGELPLHQRSEIGPAQEPVVPSYQLDRGRLENDLRQMILDDGATLIEGVSVSHVTLSEAGKNHEVELQDDAQAKLQCRWLVDATGRNAILRRRMKLTRGTRHTAHAGWFRIKGKLDIAEMVPRDVSVWHNTEFAADRWRSTNHMMGVGYWAWVIPLSTGNTSVGLVVHDDTHGFDEVRTLERTLAFLKIHEPHLATVVAKHEIMDFRCLRGYSHNVARGWSAERWAIVGEAGAFVDPLYSPGTDFIAFANSFTEEMIRVDLAGGNLQERARELNVAYRSLVMGNVDIYRDASKVFAHPQAMLSKIYWDNFAYWSYPCHFFLQQMYRLSGEAFNRLVPTGQRFVQLSQYMQALLGAWAALAPQVPKAGFWGMPAFPSVLVDAHLALQERWTPEQTLTYMKKRAEEGEELLGEMLVRVLSEVGDNLAPEVFAASGAVLWEIKIDESRIAVNDSVGLARRRALRPLARDVERSLGKAGANTSKETLRMLLQPLLEKKASHVVAPAVL